MFASLWSAFVFVSSGNWKKIPHSQTMIIISAQVMISVGAIFWSFTDCNATWMMHFQYGVFVFGMYASRINAALLSMLLYLCEIYEEQKFKLIQRIFAVVGVVFPLVLVVVIALSGDRMMSTAENKVDPFFQYGSTQASVSLAILLSCLFITLIRLDIYNTCNA